MKEELEKITKDNLYDEIIATAASYHLYRSGKISKEKMDKHWAIIDKYLDKLFE